MTQTENGEPVLIVGAGPVGLMMAARLVRHGVPVCLIDQNPTASQHSKALGIHARTLELFDQMGIVKAALDRGLRVPAGNIYSHGHRLARFDLTTIDSPYQFVLDLPQDQTERLLGEHLARLGVSVAWQTRLLGFAQDDRGVTATLQHADGREETVRTPWLIGCDGAHSTVRHALNLPFEGAPYPETWALLEATVHWTLPANEMHLFLQPEGLFIAFPMRGERWRLLATVENHAGEGLPPTPTLAEFQGYLRERAVPDATLSDPGWAAPFRIHARRAPHYRVGRVFLAGDAVHIHSPAGGQGMNTGIQDACNLAWKLGLVQGGRAPDHLLDSYEAERHPVAADVVQMTDLMTRLVTLRNPVVAAVRDHVAPLLSRIEPLAQHFATTMAEISIHYRQSPIVAEHHGGLLGGLDAAGPHAGDRAPDAGPLTGRADCARLFDLFRTPRHTLLLFAGRDPKAETWARLRTVADAVNARYADRITPHVLTLAGTTPAGGFDDATRLQDGDGAVHRRYGLDGDGLYLVRPDGYVGFRGHPADATALGVYLGRLFG